MFSHALFPQRLLAETIGQLVSSQTTTRTHAWSPGQNTGGGGPAYIHPAELRRRRERCAPVVNSLRHLPRLFISACNLCGCERSAVIAEPDRYGFPTRTAMCLRCGLFYLVDRFTDEGYAEFYGKGHYRTLSHLFSGGAGHDIAAIHADQSHYGKQMIAALDGYLQFPAGARLVDLGGSAGHVALEFQKAFQMRCTVLDPATDEVAAAQKLGLEGITGSIEGWKTDEKFDLILFCRSLEHVQDLAGVLRKIRGLLGPDGLLFCDIVDFETRCHLAGHPEAASKIDHCYWLTQETATEVFRAAGLAVVTVNIAFEQASSLVGYLLRACEPVELAAADPMLIQSRLRNLLNGAGDWRESGRHAVDSRDWLRRKAYRLKRKIVRVFE